jgi:hypothetical protein
MLPLIKSTNFLFVFHLIGSYLQKFTRLTEKSIFHSQYSKSKIFIFIFD